MYICDVAIQQDKSVYLFLAEQKYNNVSLWDCSL